MHDLRLKVLRESGKTVSKKARSRPDSHRGSTSHSPQSGLSPAHSRHGSPAHSRAGSRYASEEEELSGDDLDDAMTLSTSSNRSDDLDDTGSRGGGDWEDRLQDRIAEIQDRKRSSAKGREASLLAYVHLVRHHFAKTLVGRAAADLLPALVKSVRGGSGAEERALALQAIALTILTAPSESAYELLHDVLPAAARDADDEASMIWALNALVVAVLYGGGSPVAAADVLQLLLEIVQSDGGAVGAEDSGNVVAAALQTWAFVATHLDADDLETSVEDALDAFVDQLDSTDVDVQTGAGANVALLFELSREREEDEGTGFNLQYDPKKLITRMRELSKLSAKSISKRDRRHLHRNFASIVTSLEHGKGPGYVTAGRPGFNPHTAGDKMEQDTEFQEFGYREKIRVGTTVMVIDTWALSARVDMLKTLLGGGFPVHFSENSTVETILDGAVMEKAASSNVEETSPAKSGSKKSRKSARASTGA